MLYQAYCHSDVHLRSKCRKLEGTFTDKYAYYHSRATAYLNQGDSGRALINFTLAKLQNPDRVEAYCARAKVHQLRGNRDRAEADLTTVRRLTTISFTESNLTKAQEFVKSDAGLSLVENEDANPDDILVGKLGEIAFAKFLFEHGKVLVNTENQSLSETDVYTQDRLNLQTLDRETVDVKASQQGSILVPHESRPKDYYVGVQISDNGTIGTVEGFIGRAGLHESESYIPRPCLQRRFDSLECIGYLLEMMPEAENDAS